MGRPRKLRPGPAGPAVGPIKVAGYVRVSTEEQASEGFGLAVQERRIRAYCEAQGWELVAVFEDAGVSGKSLRRPGLTALRERANAGEFGKVVFLKLDRLSRKVRDLLELCDQLEKRGIGLVSIQEHVDTSTPSGRLFRTVLGAVAEFERDTIVARTSSGLAERARRGLWPGGRTPYGFERVGDRFEPSPREAPIARAILRTRRNGATFARIADELNGRGVKTRAGAHWWPSTIRQITENPIYEGRISWGERRSRLNLPPVLSASAISAPILDPGE